MPTYLARGVSARLGTTPLINTTLPDNIAQKYEAARRQGVKAERLLRDSKLLSEVPVPFPDDEGQHRLNWLGDAPFIQVQTYWDGPEQMCLDQTNTHMDFSTLQEPEALALHVNLSDRTYVSGLNGKKTSLKIEVFFNGQLTTCWLITTHDARTGVKGPHQVFSGTRIGKNAERPWVILPPGTAPDGGFEMNHEPVSVPQRWEDICLALQNEARERGTNENREIPPTAKFLEALASMQMPDQVHKMQKPSGKFFGTIDVVITAGGGRKVLIGAALLTAPQRMPDKNYPLKRPRGTVAADQQTHPPSEQKLSDVKYKNLGTEQELSGISVARNSHQENESPSEKHALVFGSIPQTDSLSSLDLSQLDSHGQARHCVRRLEARSGQPFLITPSGSYRDFPGQNVAQTHPLLWSSLSDTSPKRTTSHHLNSHSAQENAAPYTRNLHAFCINSHGTYYPPPMSHSESIGVEVNHFAPNLLPIPYWPPPGPLRVFENVPPFFRSDHLPGASDQSPRGVQYFPPIPYSAQMASSFVSPDVTGLPSVSVSSSGGRLVGPVPPVGLYSVPKKRDRSTISRKSLLSSPPNKQVRKIFLRRLVILGQDKNVRVDRQWDPPKHLDVGLITLVRSDDQHDISESQSTSAEPIKDRKISSAVRKPALISIRPSESLCEGKAQPDFDHTRGALLSSEPILPTDIPQRPLQNEPSSESSSCKRRKTAHPTTVEKARSSLEFKVDDNPPLNRGCVIAYAESKDKSCEEGVVRPTRGERAGTFEESYVVFATRFFVGEG